MNTLSKLAATALVVSSTGLAHAATQDFELANRNRNLSVVGVYFAHAGRDAEPWSANALSRAVAPNEVRSIFFNGLRSNDCQFDVKVVFVDGGAVVQENVNLCRVPRISAV